MDQLIAIAFIALLVFFVVKVGSILWRIAGVLFLLLSFTCIKTKSSRKFRILLLTPILVDYGRVFQVSSEICLIKSQDL